MMSRDTSSTGTSVDTPSQYRPMPFQEASIQRMVNAATSKTMPVGCLLADEQGLGKTSQMLEVLRRLMALMAMAPSPNQHAAQQRRRQRLTDHFDFIIVAPKSLVHVWKAEAAMVSEELAQLVYVCHSKLDKLEATMADEGFVLPSPCGNGGAAAGRWCCDSCLCCCCCRL